MIDDTQPAKRPPSRRIVRALLRLLVVAFAALVGLSTLLYLLQDRLIFHPRPLAPGVQERLRDQLSGTREVELRAADGTGLHGWLYRPPGTSPPPLLLYFGGNAEEVSGAVAMGAILRAWAVAAINYRGYGLSEGTPSEAALFADSLVIHDELLQRFELDRANVVAMGRSLGSGVAVYLASQRPLRAVVLTTPYDSITAVGQATYPIVPVGLLLRHPFDSLSRASSIPTPVLMLVAAEDTLIPPAHARRLYDRWAGPKQWHLLPDRHHNDIQLAPQYWPRIQAFLSTPVAPE
ncbi:MAG: alpha/beta hydrolase [Deltaproteobacteria bacterium]|jgi:fermentation-respiration switch protein FrsA (DUF1100 family)|nr:alpha/beta hydrolase [Deltaproteobacteria bacterium]MBW2536158.1 alpha/beta hydrolase [Deltaproteobacteria bacterium]